MAAFLQAVLQFQTCEVRVMAHLPINFNYCTAKSERWSFCSGNFSYRRIDCRDVLLTRQYRRWQRAAYMVEGATLTDQRSHPIIFPLLELFTGNYPVYTQRPVACRT